MTLVKNHLANCRQGAVRSDPRRGFPAAARSPGDRRAPARPSGQHPRPQWTHGGVVFAPKPRDYSYTLNKKVKRLALKSVLSAKAASQDIMVIHPSR